MEPSREEVSLPGFEVFAGLDADAGEAAVVGEGDAAVGIEMGVAFVVAQHGKLRAVDGAEFVNGQAEFEGGQGVAFDQRPAALESIAHGHFAGPWRAFLRPQGEARIVRRPAGGGLPVAIPEIGVVVSEAHFTEPSRS